MCWTLLLYTLFWEIFLGNSGVCLYCRWLRPLHSWLVLCSTWQGRNSAWAYCHSGLRVLGWLAVTLHHTLDCFVTEAQLVGGVRQCYGALPLLQCLLCGACGRVWVFGKPGNQCRGWGVVNGALYLRKQPFCLKFELHGCWAAVVGCGRVGVRCQRGCACIAVAALPTCVGVVNKRASKALWLTSRQAACVGGVCLLGACSGDFYEMSRALMQLQRCVGLHFLVFPAVMSTSLALFSSGAPRCPP
jgi:hypothetical protein